MDTETVVKDVNLDKIITDGQMIRYSVDDEHVVELSLSIAQKGLLEPIVVQEAEDGKYQLVAGMCRLTAFRRLKKDTIPAVIRPNDGSPIKGLALIENVVRRDMTLAEEVEAVSHLHDAEKMSPGQICDLIGKSRAWVDQRLAIPNLYPEVVNELLDGRISLRHAEIANSLESEALRALLLNTIIQNKLTARQAKELAALYLETPSMEDAIEEGIKKKREVQTQTIPQRTCDACGTKRNLSDIELVAVCRGGCAGNQERE